MGVFGVGYCVDSYMRLLLKQGQNVFVNDCHLATVSAFTPLLLDLCGDFDGANLDIGNFVAVGGLRFLVIGLDSELLHLEICGDVEMGSV